VKKLEEKSGLPEALSITNTREVISIYLTVGFWKDFQEVDDEKIEEEN
jgi:hypothetical protein